MNYSAVMAWARSITLNQYTNKYKKANDMKKSMVIRDAKPLKKKEFKQLEEVVMEEQYEVNAEYIDKKIYELFKIPMNKEDFSQEEVDKKMRKQRQKYYLYKEL